MDMKTKTNLKGGAFDCFRKPKPNHNQTVVRDGIKAATNLKAGLFDVFRRPPQPNHNQTFVLDAGRRRVKVASGVKAGLKFYGR
jgi:hypothetical protein